MAERIVWKSGMIAMGGFFAVAGGRILTGDRRLNRAGLDLIGREREGPVRRSPAMVIAKTTYIVTAAMSVIAGTWLPLPGFYLVGLTVMLTLSLWVLLHFFLVAGLLGRPADGSKTGTGSARGTSDPD